MSNVAEKRLPNNRLEHIIINYKSKKRKRVCSVNNGLPI